MTYLRQHKTWPKSTKETPHSLDLKQKHNVSVQEKKRLIAEHQAKGTLTKDVIHNIYYGK